MRRLRSWSSLVLLGLALLGAAGAPASAGVPSFAELREGKARSEQRLLDREGRLVHEARRDLRVRSLGWVALADVSPALREGVLASEDRRFYRHLGVDWMALAAAARSYVLGRAPRGASTISMQVASLLDPELRPRAKRRGWRQKLAQIWGAMRLERAWSKDQILEAYLNLVSFRGELQGVASASRGLFGKAPSGLNQEESLVLAALIRAPQADEARVAERACRLAEATHMAEACSRITELVHSQGLATRPFRPEIALAPHLARKLAREKRDHSTLDRDVQAKVYEILRRQVLSWRARNMNDAAALVVDNATGQVIAYVGGVGELSSAREVDGVQARRQAGSTLKPFLYGLAIENRYLTAASKLDDSETNFSLGTGAVYRPRDFDKEYHGDDVTLRTALASSLNIPAVRTLQLLGVGSFVDRLGKLGFQGLLGPEFYGPSLALGTADVSLWELVNAFRTLANGGLASPLVTSLPAPAPEFKRVASEEATFIVSDILSDSGSRSLTFGLMSPLSLRFWAAAKTGTSKDMRDNWCVGYSARYTVGVWAGNFSGDPMWNVTGVSGAAPAWAEVMGVLHQTGRGVAPVAPRGVTRAGDEWYLAGTEPSATLAGAHATPVHRARIVYPAEGLMIARDPDIPARLQRVFFEASAPDASLNWVLNGKLLGPASSSFAWTPGKPGEYELALVVAYSGEALDRIGFTVRR